MGRGLFIDLFFCFVSLAPEAWQADQTKRSGESERGEREAMSRFDQFAPVGHSKHKE